MKNSVAASQATPLAASLATLGRANHRAELLAVLEHSLHAHTHAQAINITWLDEHGAAVFSTKPDLPVPSAAEQALLANAQIIHHDDQVFVPLLAAGMLRGWITLHAAQMIEPAYMLASQAGLALALLEHTAAAAMQPALNHHTDDLLISNIAALEQRNQHLASLVEAGDRLRTTGDITEVSHSIVAALQTLTNSPRLLVYITDVQREWVTLRHHVGLNERELASIQNQAMKVPDAEAAIKAFQPISTHFYRAKGTLPNSPFEDCALLVLSDQQHAPVGCVVFDLVDYERPVGPALVQALEVLSNQAASALITAWLMDEQQRTVDRLIALSAFSLAATSTSLAPTELMAMTIGGAMGTTQGIAGGMVMRNGYDLAPYHQGSLSPPVLAAIEQLIAEQTEVIEYAELASDDLPQIVRDAGVCSLVCVPLRGTKLALGQLWVAYATPLVQPADREMVLLYAKTAGAVLENAHLFDQLRTAHDRLSSIMASSNDGILMASASGEILVVNTALSRMLCVPEGVFADADVETLLQMIAQHNGDPSLLASALQNVACDERAAYAGELHLTIPEQRDLTWTVAPVQASGVPAHAALLVMRDVTAEYQASKLRQDLSHMVVHDLRAPLANIIASLDLLLKQRIGPLTPRQERITQIASEASRHMAELVNALLDMRRLERWQFELHSQPHVLFTLVQETSEQFEQVAQARQITIENATAAVPPVSVDGDLLRRVFQNLIDNALKFSGADSVIRIEAAEVDETQLPPEHLAGRWVLVRVVDQGPGVPEAYRTHIFELFGQAPSGKSRGSGIGLAFCKLAVGAHGGMIWATDAPDGGASFCFTLPVA